MAHTEYINFSGVELESQLKYYLGNVNGEIIQMHLIDEYVVRIVQNAQGDAIKVMILMTLYLVLK